MTISTAKHLNHTLVTRTVAPEPRDWRCSCCGKLLGQRHGSSVLIRFARGHQYRAVRPVTAICRSCHTLNELS